MLNTVFCEEKSMKKTIYILILICVLTLLPSCGESGEPQENRPGFSEKGSEAEAANPMVFLRNTPFSCSPLVGGMHCLHGDEGGTFSCFTCRHNLQAFSDLFHRYGNRRNTNLPACFAVACCCFIFLVSMPDDPFFVYQTNT